ncbi:MAG: phosphoglycerate dehydrogenase [Dethiobacter sp.]|nr:phosphoglycerate dehydrogenase [Dethiobacter sp.]
MRVLVSEEISEQGLDKLREKALVDVLTGLSPDELMEKIPAYDALIVRSSTKVTRSVLEAGVRLKVVGRAGVGVDNIDVEAATERGIIVINAPEGNIISAAEHTIAMMTSLARNIPSAVSSLKAGLWKRSEHMGVELFKKTLGVIGIGRVGSEVSKRARAMGMEIIAYDPYISVEHAAKIGATMASVEEVCRRADFITLHAPLTPKTRYIIGKSELAVMKDGVRLINCARGGLIDEQALYDALKSGKVAGAALDVFEQEPALNNPLFEFDNVLATPHLGASTAEAQVNVAVQVAEHVISALLGEPLLSAVNVPVIPPETMAGVLPFIPLMKTLGSFYTQVFNGKVEAVDIIYSGEIAGYPVTPLTNSLLIGLLSSILHETVNYVNVAVVTKQRGIRVREITSKTVENFANLITVNIKSNGGTNTIAGTLFHKNDPRIVQIGKHRIEVSPSRYMLVTTHIDLPGVIGSVGTLLGKNNVNIAGMQVGRESIGGEAVMVLQVDGPVPEEILSQVEQLTPISSVFFVRLD